MRNIVESAEVEIGSPAWFVWQVMVDYPRYPEWNPFTIAVETTLKIDDPIDLTLRNPDGSAGTFVNREFIRVVDPPHHLRYDTGDLVPGVLGARDQYVVALDENRCSYRTTDTFTGEHAHLVIQSHGAWIKAGFDSVAHSLKVRSESLWAQTGVAVEHQRHQRLS
jgi:hypothetical protein